MNGQLTHDQAFSATGCGAGTEQACFALTISSAAPGGEMLCAMQANPQVAQTAGIQLGWRVNVDDADDKVWCPLGVLDNSKTQ